MMNHQLTVTKRHSGYTAGTEQWAKFLSCWYDAGLARHKEQVRKTPDLPYLPILGKYALEPAKRPPVENMLQSIERLEMSLGDALPQSYKDFLLSYQPPLLTPQAISGGTALIGMYTPSQVGRVAVLDLEGAKLAEKYPIEMTDKEYFIYGTKQDETYGRTRYIRDAIIVGKYGASEYELVVLYPQVRTSDGEMEAALHFHSGAFRAPSFAELMRQLSILETKAVDHVPPYPQRILHGTCADKLPIANAWWD